MEPQLAKAKILSDFVGNLKINSPLEESSSEDDDEYINMLCRENYMKSVYSKIDKYRIETM